MIVDLVHITIAIIVFIIVFKLLGFLGGLFIGKIFD